MAYNDKDGIVDIFGGMQDLEKHMIRCVGNARERFSEDALRILRGVRFAAQLGFEIDEETKEGMKLLAPTLENISAERIQVELVKMLTSDRPELIRTAYEMGIKTIMITGDNPITAAAIAAEAGVDDFLAEATPEGKLAMIRDFQMFFYNMMKLYG